MAIPGSNAELNRKVAIKIGADVSAAVASFGLLGDVVKEASMAFTGFNEVMIRANNVAKKAGTGFIAFGAAINTSLTASALSMAKFEQAFVGVRKTVNASEADLDRLAIAIRKMSTTMPVAATELARVGQVAGQLGVQTQNLEMFVKTAAQLGIATDMSASQAISGLSRIIKVANESETVVDNLGSSLVHLGNTMNTTEGQILDMAQNIAGTAGAMGVATDEIVGIAAAFSAAGVEAEAGGTAINRVFIEMNEAARNSGPNLIKFADLLGMTARQFETAFKTNPGQVFADFVEVLRNAGPDAQNVIQSLGFGSLRLARAFGNVANSSTSLSTVLNESGKAFDANRALAEENAKAIETFQNQMQIFRNTMTEAVRGFGGPFLDVLTKGVGAVNYFTSAMVKMSQPVKDALSIFAGLVGTFSIAAGAVLKMLVPLGMLRIALSLFGREAKATTSILGNFFAGFRGTEKLQRSGVLVNAMAGAMHSLGQKTRLTTSLLGSFFKTNFENDMRAMRRADKIRAGEGRYISKFGDLAPKTQERLHKFNPFSGMIDRRNARMLGESVAEGISKEAAEEQAKGRFRAARMRGVSIDNAITSGKSMSGLERGQNITPRFYDFLQANQTRIPRYNAMMQSDDLLTRLGGRVANRFRFEQGKFLQAMDPYRLTAFGGRGPSFVKHATPLQRGIHAAGGALRYSAGAGIRAARTGVSFGLEGLSRGLPMAMRGLSAAALPLTIAFAGLSAASAKATKNFEEASAKFAGMARAGESFAAQFNLQTKAGAGSLSATVSDTERLREFFTSGDGAPLASQGRRMLEKFGRGGLRKFVDSMQIDLQQQGNSPEDSRRAARRFMEVNFPALNPDNFVRSVSANNLGDVLGLIGANAGFLSQAVQDRNSMGAVGMYGNALTSAFGGRGMEKRAVGDLFNLAAEDAVAAGARLGTRSPMLELFTYASGFAGTKGAMKSGNSLADLNAGNFAEVFGDKILDMYPALAEFDGSLTNFTQVVDAMEKASIIDARTAATARTTLGELTPEQWQKINTSEDPMAVLREIAPEIGAVISKEFPLQAIAGRFDSLRPKSAILRELDDRFFERTGVTESERAKLFTKGLREQQMEKSGAEWLMQLKRLTSVMEKEGLENSDMFHTIKDLERQERAAQSSAFISDIDLRAKAAGKGSAGTLAMVRGFIADTDLQGEEALELKAMLESKEKALQRQSINNLLTWASQRKKILNDLTDSESKLNRDRARAWEDFAKNIRRQVEDSTRALANSMNPYNRDVAALNMGGSGLLFNTQFQTRQMEQQTADLQQLQAMGLSSEAIEFFDFGNSQNRGAVARTLATALNDSGIIEELNAAVSQRMSAAGGLFEFNRADLDRQTERQRADMQESFNRQKIDLLWQLDQTLIEPELAAIEEALEMARATGDPALIKIAEDAYAEYQKVKQEILATENILLNIDPITGQVRIAGMLTDSWMRTNEEVRKYLEATGTAFPGSQTVPEATDRWESTVTGAQQWVGESPNPYTYFTKADIEKVPTALQGRAGKWQQAINAAAVKHGIDPSLFAALIKQESNFKEDAESHAGAYGLAQLMPGTAAALGVDPKDPLQNLDGGARYLREMLDRFGDPALALAAYNAGPNRQSLREGRIPNIAETQDYVKKVMANWDLYSQDAGMYTANTRSYNFEVGERSWTRNNPTAVNTSITTTTYTGDITVEATDPMDFERQLAERQRRQNMTRAPQVVG